ncbi:MAG: hypothetical protein R3B13_05195 [Polyangiaceae bacterium]
MNRPLALAAAVGAAEWATLVALVQRAASLPVARQVVRRAARLAVAVAGGGCTFLAADVEGDYFLAFGPSFSGTAPSQSEPIRFSTNLQASQDALVFAFQALDATDHSTPVGNIVKVIVAPSTNGAFDVDLPVLDIPGEANPNSGSPMSVDLTSFRGTLCGTQGEHCGEADGDMTKPLPLNLDGSTWAMTKAIGSFPNPPKIDCQGNTPSP